ncbi:hypothetical protein Tsubulata_040229 [Turnera subulata]|uniref:DUF676 domain-containing protein n=1 Tax=Turnera subulata TaxID=218843 RepID=A0A9Q0JF42_9ROSI|nr:hypothetical protein Tsubulata_040229 [Turnera subulata]
MGSLELRGGGSMAAKEDCPNGNSIETVSTQNNEKAKTIGGKTKRWRRKYSYLPKLGCLRVEKDKGGNFNIEVEQANPTHLVIMVNGIIGSAQNWKYAAKQFLKKYPGDVIVHCSHANSALLTLDGVDVMGQRLAEEVISVIKRHPSVQKISFVGHSLGGLIARYAIAKLYQTDSGTDISQGNRDCSSNGHEDRCMEDAAKGTIAGLEPVNFITSATPHLGSRWHKQVPLYCGSYALEKTAARISWLLGRTGKHLFLTDGDNGTPPLLLQMVNDSEDLKFISALQSFKRRVAYANACSDSLVGWSTSSLRRRNELPKRKHFSRHEKYPHIVNVESAKSASLKEDVTLDAKADEGQTVDMEEEMIRGLTKLSWERVDVDFSGSVQKLMAHSTIQVKSPWINSAGADVIQHMVDSFLL